MGWVGGGQGWRVGSLDWHPGFSFFVGRLAKPPRGRGVWFEQGACSPADPLIGGLVGLGSGCQSPCRSPGMPAHLYQKTHMYMSPEGAD